MKLFANIRREDLSSFPPPCRRTSTVFIEYDALDIVSIMDPDPDPVRSEIFGWIRIRILIKSYYKFQIKLL